jgi:hypothetical protein
MGFIHRNHQLLLLLVLPDGSRSHIPADWTDFQHKDNSGATDHAHQAATVASLSDLLHARSIIDALLRRLPASCDKTTQLTEKENKRATVPRPHEGSNPRHSSVGKLERRPTRRPDRSPD